MAEYFENSQLVRREIESRPDLKNKITMCLDNKIEPFSFGGTVNLYRVGKLKSGLYIALRRFRSEMPEGMSTFNNKRKMMEAYCQNAERLKNEGEEVPNFCVGAVNNNDAAILTEDLTSNGKVIFEHHPDTAFGFIIKDEARRKVWVDIDYLYGDIRKNRNPEIKYFSNGEIINLQ